ncbi:Kelch repeat type 1,Galactose oxidase, beta-propeller [Cinara cedri]|uniref:Kelch repeat type 1,Galactose oxidase, beta-propeller n=1 Tax=Cinara cedri TaxID=506608 RepID=A0A5E4MRY3_9HEMI|nr:Kelch repeat type 1,Galactose oxidase, beta-propeller [Cinara cedri]
MNTVECYDAEANVWTIVTPMQTRRSGVSCIAYHNCLYVMGGFNGLFRMNTGEKFDPTTNRWSPVVEMGSPRSNFAIEVLDDMIFVAGGFNGVTTIAQVECYNDRTDEWFEAKSMQIFRSALAACVIKNLPNVAYYMPSDRDKLSEEGRVDSEMRTTGRSDNESDRGVDGVSNVSAITNLIETADIDNEDTDNDDNVIFEDAQDQDHRGQ